MNHYTIKYENDEAFNNILYRNGWMHWQPMSEDAVFEDGKAYLVAMTMYEGSTRIDRIVYAEGSFWINDEEYETVHFSHYARITEPK